MSIIVTGTIDFDPASADEAIAAVTACMEATRARSREHYAFSGDFGDPGRMYVSEQWASQEAIEDAHGHAASRRAHGGDGEPGRHGRQPHQVGGRHPFQAHVARRIMGAMFDVDDFIDRCEEARQEPEPRRAIREVLERAVSAPAEVSRALNPTEGGFTLVHHTDDLTILHVVWAPGMRIYPHDHRMWAAIGIYEGQEDNAFYRRSGPGEKTLVESGGKALVVGDTVVLGDDTIHGVANRAGAHRGRSTCTAATSSTNPAASGARAPLEERPYDIDEARRQFAEANAAWRASTS